MIKYFLILVIILVLIGAYLLIFNKPTEKKEEDLGCPPSFTLYPYGQILSNAVAVNYSTDGSKYFSQTSGGYGGYQGQLAKKEISKETFLAACKSYQQQSGNPLP